MKRAGASELCLQALSLAVVASSATQLRILAVPVGIGEAAMLACIAWRWLRPPAIDESMARLRPLRLFALAIVWVALASWFAAQLASSAAAGVDDPLAARIAAAIAVSALFAEAVFTLAARPEDRARLCARIAGWAAVLSALALAIGMAGPAVLRDVVWYESGVRLRALSDNPNQFGLLLTFSLLSLPLAWQGSRAPSSRIALATAAAVLVAGGLASRSDAMLVAVAVGALPVMVFAATDRNLRSHVRQAGLAAVGAAACAVLLSFSLVVDFAAPIAQRVFEQGNQGSDRFALWQSAWESFARSPLFGSGPVPQASLQRIEGPLEAHNLFFDWASMTGVVGLAALLLGVVFAASGVMRHGRWLHAAPFVGVVVFSLFHFTLRQPVFWLSIALALTASLPGHATERRAPCAA